MKTLLFTIFFLIPSSYAFAEPNEIPIILHDQIPISISDKMTDVIFDGKWTFSKEWKHSSLVESSDLKIRSAHQGEFVYFMLNYVSDTSYAKNSDRAMICFDTKNNLSFNPDSDDYCFLAVVGKINGHILQGGTPFPLTNHLEKIPNHKEYVGIGNFSDGNDRYSKIPHSTYEFKIPTEVIGRSNVYGIYIEVFDSNSGKKISWPSNPQSENPQSIPSPQNWGQLISIDSSLPEFSLPMLTLSLLMATIIVLGVKTKLINI
ncbi:hypothetical protein [Nitrosopumilus sp. S6]